MRDCVVVGCGRSGTSLAAGLLAHAGYHCGQEMLPADDGGPAGFFEARELNAINERLLAGCPQGPALVSGYSRALRDGERWLAVLAADAEPDASPELLEAMRRALPPSPYCCKDPRFGYTLDAWRPLFGDALFVCVFREPAATAESIARQVRYGDLTVDPDTAVEVWNAIYRRVLDRHRRRGDWLFVHYEQLLDGSGVERLAAALEAPLDAGFAEPGLRRARGGEVMRADTANLYAELCASAGYAA